ncbi:MAG: hypothetical protein ABUT20_24910 [Bacteroidota bacterium]
MSELLGKWVSRFENDSMILEFTDIARVTWGVPKKSGKLKNIKCEYRIDTIGHEMALFMRVPDQPHFIILLVRKEKADEFKAQYCDPSDPKTSVNGWATENVRNTKLFRKE